MNKITALLLLLIGLLQYRLWYGDGNVLEFQRLNDRIAELHQEGAKRRERNAALEAEVIDLKQGQEAVEERGRQDLGMIKEGEVFVQVIDPHHEDEASPALSKEKPSQAPAKPGFAKAGKEAKPGDAGKPRPTESPATAKPKPAAIKTDKPQAGKTSPNKAVAKPTAAPVKPRPKAPAATHEEPIEERPSTFEID